MTDLPSLTSLQHELETLFNKNQLMPRLRDYYGPEQFPLIHQINEQVGMPTPILTDIMVQIALHKRTTPEIMIGILLPHKPDDAQYLADCLDVAIEMGALDIDNTGTQLIVIHDIPHALQEELDTFQFPLPMIIEPMNVRKNSDTGYLNSRGSLILKNNHHNKDICLDHINRLNKIRLTLNHRVATMVQNKWKSIDRPKDDETLQDFQKRRRAFDKYNSTAKVVLNILQSAGNVFHLTHKYDKRGRTYCQGHHITYQGAAWNKAVIELADKELVLTWSGSGSSK